MLCAPQCWNTIPSNEYPQDLTLSTNPDLPPSLIGLFPNSTVSCNGAEYAVFSIGPGPSTLYGASDPTLIGSASTQNITYTSCPGGQFISQWDLRGFNNKEGLASLGARCTDGTLLTPVPTIPDDTAPLNFGFDVYQIQNSPVGWNIFDALAFDGDAADQTPYLDFLGVGGAEGKALQCPQWDSGPCDECFFGPPVMAARAIGYQASALSSGGVTLLNVLCAFPCTGYQPPDSPERYIKNTFISSWSFRTDQYTTAASNGSVTTSLIGSLSGSCSDGSSLSAATRQSQNGIPGAWINGSTQTDATESTLGYSSFELTPLTQQVLTGFIGYDNNIVQNEILACPTGYIAIGYSALSSFFGIPYLDIICGPVVPATCQAGAPGTGTVSTLGNNGNPFLYTSSSGGPSWTNYAPGAPSVGSSVAYVVPPPPNAPGDSINGALLSPSETILEVVIALTGPNLRLLEVQAPTRQLLQMATNVTEYNIVGIICRSSKELFVFAETLAAAINNGTFSRILAQYNITASAILESTKARTTLSAVDTPSSPGSSELSGGDIAGIVVGSVVGALLVTVAAYCAVRHCRRRQAICAGMS
ncbi:hypothetical protein WJX73_005101 [Symbiochloris irregularis]|uniref:Solute-binding protein family 3/N-terminal domain-containing protein n=1 Tax=Symbiochloris irregularis TaxID=706552 RepID=A0AAW1P3H2_9CHLO